MGLKINLSVHMFVSLYHDAMASSQLNCIVILAYPVCGINSFCQVVHIDCKQDNVAVIYLVKQRLGGLHPII